eukprot:269151_1
MSTNELTPINQLTPLPQSHTLDALLIPLNHSKTARCICCHGYDLLFDKFSSPNCFDEFHCYCIKCALKIINQSLSLYNQIPNCVIPNCNMEFNISLSTAINLELFVQYKIDIKQYEKDQILLHAYIQQKK